VDLSFEPESFSGWAPLFPLPGVVLMPGALLPLHVFEQRYRIMLRDALEGEKLIAMALLEPGFEAEYHDAPAIAGWVGLGRIVAHESLEDGRSNLLLAGLRRARVLEEDRSNPYRRARLEVVEDDESDLDAPALDALRARVVGLLERLPASSVRDPVRLGVARKMTQVPLGALLDLAADALHLDVREKQSLLQEPRVRERASRLVALVRARIGEAEGGTPWPPRFSRN
jgi:Lon protease-like protein